MGKQRLDTFTWTSCALPFISRPRSHNIAASRQTQINQWPVIVVNSFSSPRPSPISLQMKIPRPSSLSVRRLPSSSFRIIRTNSRRKINLFIYLVADWRNLQFVDLKIFFPQRSRLTCFTFDNCCPTVSRSANDDGTVEPQPRNPGN